MVELRLGDDVDDYCIKCKRLTNHTVLALVGELPAKVRCRTCYHEQPFRNSEVPPTKKDLKKAALFNAVLSTIPGGVAEATAPTAAAGPKARKQS